MARALGFDPLSHPRHHALQPIEQQAAVLAPDHDLAGRDQQSLEERAAGPTASGQHEHGWSARVHD